ncbi:hypothetical protein SAY87_011491 [Trapa incisa]|uniref:Uncharacterized protein n=1 Tax=Trapa incisa TaxID=236973 RepID=A0AAN7JIC4_9MYRT|nr:hypothetical protein SAY87_011491 [Trapa incisa]
MADLVSHWNADRDIDQALIALKKGAQLLKFGRKGKPKFYQFRLSSDESSLIWLSSGSERSLKLASVTRIIPGQRTAVFRRYLPPEKDDLSFSLIYNDGKRFLDLICKDKVEAELWIAGLKALISSGQGGRFKIDGWYDGSFYLNESRDLISGSPSEGSVSATGGNNSPDLFRTMDPVASPNNLVPENPMQFGRSHVASRNANVLVRGFVSADAFRVSISSLPSTSSHSSTPDDYDASGDIYIWGEILCDTIIKVGPEKDAHFMSNRTDVLLPRPLESYIVLDVHQMASGASHAAVVTKQGEIFTWGEETGGCIGHGIGKDVLHPRLVESLGLTNLNFVACGEFHTCAVTVAGEIYTWGDGTRSAGLLGHGKDAIQWIPKRISGPLEGLQIANVSCGPFHTALITSTGRLFTFGDGTFGVLGHGDRLNVVSPREVEALAGFRTISVACGVWHTAAVVEVIVNHSSVSTSSGKLFTWGDGDKNRLGQGDKEPRLKPTCVPAIIDRSFCKVACGHSLTVGLTTSGQVFTMGSTVYGQLGNPLSDGKLPCSVEDKLADEAVEEISCGSYHVAVLTSRNEVYTWGKGANGRLGHGDVKDRKTPTLVEALKDKHVKYIACGSNYSAAICLHKWVAGAEQSQCSACRQAFGFTRKRHNCHNCGLVHCHSCSTRKAVRAALAPNPWKPYRVCDSCYMKLTKASDCSVNGRRNTLPRLSGENKDRIDKADLMLSEISNVDMIKQLDNKAAKHGRKSDGLTLVRSSPPPSFAQFKYTEMSTDVDLQVTGTRSVLTPSVVSSRSVSPFSRRMSPSCSVTPVPAIGISFSKSIADSLKRTNELLNHEVLKLRAEVESLRCRCEQQEVELQKSTKKAQEATSFAVEESAKSKAAKDIIKSLTEQLKDITERLPPGTFDDYSAGLEDNGMLPNGIHSYNTQNPSVSPPLTFNESANDCSEIRSLPIGDEGNGTTPSNGLELGDGDSDSFRSSSAASVAGDSGILLVEAEWIEQYEPGVYITLMALRDGTRDLKRVRFSRRRFKERQAETWWSENRERVYERYNVRGSDKSSVSGQAAWRSEVAMSPVSQV